MSARVGSATLNPAVSPAVSPAVKPRFRGRIHQVAFWTSLPAGLVLIAMSRDGLARAAAVCFAASLAALFGASAAYHRGDWTPRARNVWQRVDHAMIFVLIAGSYTPITLLAMQPTWGLAFLAVIWTLAVVGVTLTLARFSSMRRLSGLLYIALGWSVIVALPVILRSLSVTELVLMFAGGVLYTIGAIGLSLRRPSLRPTTFGYHEYWHAMTVAAAACHFALVALLVTS